MMRVGINEGDTCNRQAVLAGQMASEAAGDILTFALDGPHKDASAVGEETVQRLAEALKIAIAIEVPHLDIYNSCVRDHQEALEQLSAAAARYLADWSW